MNTPIKLLTPTGGIGAGFPRAFILLDALGADEDDRS